MKEVACPNGERIKDEKRNVTNTPERHHSFPYVEHKPFDLLVEEHRFPQPVKQNHHTDEAEQDDIKPDGSEQMQQRRNLRAGLMQKSGEHGHLKQNGNSRYQQNGQRIYQTFGNYRTQRLGERHIVVLRQHSAPAHFTDSRHDETGGIGYKNGVDTMSAFWKSIQWLQCLPPAPTAEHLSKHSEDKRKKHPPPVHFMQQHLTGFRKIEIAVDPKQNKATQNERRHHIQRLF